MTKSILITGCSSGIGLSAAKILHEKGWHVFATARRDQDLQMLKHDLGISALYLDYSEPQSISETASKVLEETDNKLYGLFNNGAYGQPGAVEDLTPDVLRAQFEANVIGWHDLTVRLLPAMRRANQGRIIQCSSVFGFVSGHYRGAYNASKYAIEALSDAMRQELRDTNIYVSLIEPGPIRTRFVENAIEAYEKNIDIDNSPHTNKYKSRLEGMKKGGADVFKLEPEIVVEKLLHALTSRQPKSRYYVTIPTYFLAYAKRLLPTKLIDEILIRN